MKGKITKGKLGKPFGQFPLTDFHGRKIREGFYVNETHYVRGYATGAGIGLTIYHNGISYHKDIELNYLVPEYMLSRQASLFSKEVRGLEHEN